MEAERRQEAAAKTRSSVGLLSGLPGWGSSSLWVLGGAGWTGLCFSAGQPCGPTIRTCLCSGLVLDSLQAQLISMDLIPTLVKLLGLHSHNAALTEMCLIAFGNLAELGECRPPGTGSPLGRF